MVRFYYAGHTWHHQDFASIEEACNFLMTINCTHWAIYPHECLTDRSPQDSTPPLDATLHHAQGYQPHLPVFDAEEFPEMSPMLFETSQFQRLGSA